MVSLNDIVLGVERLVRRLMPADIHLSIVVDPAAGPVRVDPVQIEQAILNLAANARDAMLGGGTLTIATRNVEVDESFAQQHSMRPGEYLMLSVSDTGTGIDRETRIRIFEPFFTTKERGNGTGLGLASVFGVVKQIGGAIRVQSEPGRGATFDIYLARSKEVPESDSSTRARPATLHGSETVLVVDDEMSLRTILSLVLRRHGYSALEASDGAEALRISEATAGEIHLLITDIELPHMSGFELVSRLQRTRPRLKVLYVSGHSEESLAGPTERGPAMAFLEKPLTPAALAIKTREVLNAVTVK